MRKHTHAYTCGNVQGKGKKEKEKKEKKGLQLLFPTHLFFQGEKNDWMVSGVGGSEAHACECDLPPPGDDSEAASGHNSHVIVSRGNAVKIDPSALFIPTPVFKQTSVELLAFDEDVRQGLLWSR